MILHEEPAEYSGWIKLLFLIPVGLAIGAFCLLYSQEYEGFYTLISESAFFILLLYSILPRRYQIYQDKLRISLGAPFGINIPLSTIKEVKQSSGIKAFIYPGIRFATSTRNIIEVVRNKGSNYVISPQNKDMFIEELNEAIKNREIN